VGTEKRVFFMYPETQVEQEEWMNALSQVIDNLKKASGGGGGTRIDPVTTNPDVKTPDSKPDRVTEKSMQGAGSSTGPAANLKAAVKQVPFLQDPNKFVKPLEFWEIWQDSIPDDIDMFRVAVSLDLSQISWRCIGPQNKLIQKMVDFFWNVGAPETEIDRLNDVGTLINPLVIGSWIDMSAKGGMDGGWYFPCEIPLKLALEASDPGEATKKVADWAQSHHFESVFVVGRDMGAAPPRQTHFEFCLQGDFEQQFQVALSAYEAFGFSLPPEDALNIIKGNPKPELSVSVIVSSEGFVKLGLMTPRPEAVALSKLCALSNSAEILEKFERALGVDGVEWVEYKFLQKGFGYGVYKEGFDVVFHYAVGKEP